MQGSRLLRSLVAASAVVGWCNCVSAIQFQASEIAPPPGVVGEHQTLQRTWTVYDANELRELHLVVPGRAFVDADTTLSNASGPSASNDATVASANQSEPIVARIVLTSDSSSVLDLAEPITLYDGAVKLHMKNVDATLSGYLLTQVYVARTNTLRTVGVAYSDNVIVGNDVLPTDDREASIRLRVAGRTNLFWYSDDAALNVAEVDSSVAGSGRIQLKTPQIQVHDKLTLSTSGSGNVELVSDSVDANIVRLSVAGSGHVLVQTPALTTTKLDSSITGSGSVSVASEGTCRDQSVSTVGSGSVFTGSIVCQQTHVSMIGSSAETIVQSKDKLSISTTFSSGTVHYFGARPEHVSTVDLRFGHDVSAAPENKFLTAHLSDLPTRQAVLIRVTLKHSPFLLDATITDESDVSLASAPARTSTKPTVAHGLMFIGLVGSVMAVYRHRVRRVRATYQPLV